MDCSVGANDVKKGNCEVRSSPLQVQDFQQRQAGNSAHLAARRRSTLCLLLHTPSVTSGLRQRAQSVCRHVRLPKQVPRVDSCTFPRNVTPPRILA
jgi:hypothetical protein